LLTDLYRLCWYVADKYLRDFKTTSGSDLPPRVLNGILALAEFLVSEARTLESGTEGAKKEAKEQIPVDRVKDAPAFARELRWRVKQAMGDHSDDETSGNSRGTTTPAGTKRRRVDDQDDGPQFRNFRPKSWDSVITAAAEDSQRTTKAPKPAEDDVEWTKAFTLNDMKDEGEEATVSSRREVVIKLRRTAQGLERQRIERTVEGWRWDS
jgi:F-box/leucine-rich repeat protein 10/11